MFRRQHRKLHDLHIGKDFLRNAQSIKEKIEITLKWTSVGQKPIKKVQKQATTEKTDWTHTTIYLKNSYKLARKDNPIDKWAKGMKRHFYHRGNTNSPWSYEKILNFISNQGKANKTHSEICATVPDAVKDSEQEDAGGSVNWSKYFGNSDISE